MRRRLSEHLRCEGCRLHLDLCMCALIPKLETRSHVVLVLHQLETRKPTNTGRLAVSCLRNGHLVLRGVRPPGDAEEHDERVHVPEGTQPVLLFPHDDAEPLARWRDHDRPVSLIVPDGTWGQAVRVRKRMRGLEGVPTARLPDGLASDYRLRTAPRPGHVSTMEAIAYALGILEGPAVQETLRRVHRMMVHRTLWANGRLDAAEVEGGIPSGARRH